MQQIVLHVFCGEMFVSCGGFRCCELLAVVAHSLHDHTNITDHLQAVPELATMLQTMTCNRHVMAMHPGKVPGKISHK